MKVHHLACLTMCPPVARLVNRGGGWLARGRLVCHCLLLETDRHGLVLVDTGIGCDDCRDPTGRLGFAFARIVIGRPPPEADTALRQVERLGFRAEDVRHVVLTHLDLDHAGGLADFPHAAVHLLADEHAAALAPATPREAHRYRQAHWAHGPRWETYGTGGEPWRGFARVTPLRGLPPEVALVPLPGHTRGHAAVAVESADGPLLHCGDAYFHRSAIDPAAGPVPVGLWAFERLLAMDRARVLDNHRRLAELRAGGEVALFCAHDPDEMP